MTAIEPRRAAVRPRVLVCAGGVARLLSEEVAELLARGQRAMVWLRGEVGSGKSTALAHLAAEFAGDARLRLYDGVMPTAGDHLVDVVAHAGWLRRPSQPAPPLQEWTMAPWSDDECLEYLQVRHRQRAFAAWTTWRATNAEHDLRRWPGLCTEVLDVLARDDGPADAHQALREILHGLVATLGEAPRRRALQQFLRRGPGGQSHMQASNERERRMLQSRTACALLAVEHLLACATAASGFVMPTLAWSRELALAIMVVLQQEPAREASLRTWLRSDGERDRRLAWSLLAVANQGYRPEPDPLRDGAHAFLAFTDLEGMTLLGDFSGAHLAHARLQRATLQCRLHHAALRGADLTGAKMVQASCRGLSAPGLIAPRLSADQCDFTRAQLTGACLQRASLARAELHEANLADVDFQGANLEFANLSHTDLRTARLQGANLRGARLHHVRASDVICANLAAVGSDWSYADLTGSRLPAARLSCGVFDGCGLANVDWQGADLRDADLRGATFHLGNARCGLVGSDLASEGSRTGFYTDESFEDHFQAPELVRKANLQDCDLRGAKLDDVDLYLVDLRGAKLDAKQRSWARRCRALLGEQAAE